MEILLKTKIASFVQSRVLKGTQFPGGDNWTNTDNKIQSLDALTPAGFVDIGHVWTVLFEGAKAV